MPKQTTIEMARYNNFLFIFFLIKHKNKGTKRRGQYISQIRFSQTETIPTTSIFIATFFQANQNTNGFKSKD